MELKVLQADEELTHIALSGELDMAGQQEVETAFLEQIASRKKPTMVDMAEVPFLTSMGVRMLLEGAKALAAAGAKMVILNPQTIVEEVLESAGMTQLLRIAHDTDEAFGMLRS